MPFARQCILSMERSTWCWIDTAGVNVAESSHTTPVWTAGVVLCILISHPKNSSGGFMQDWDGWINLAACQSFLITSTAYWCEFFRHIWLIREVEHLVISRGYIHGITSAWVNWALFWETWLQGSWKPNTFSALLQFLYCFINFVNQGIPWVHTQCPI